MNFRFKSMVAGIVLLIITIHVSAQNVAVSDDDNYTADPSAMLDVKSISKGFLVPRLTTAERMGITTPASGLMVYDTDKKKFYFFTGSTWQDMSDQGIWVLNGSDVLLSNTNYNVSIGSSAPTGKLLVKGDNTITANEPLFSVVNTKGDTVFAVYSGGVRINVEDTPGKASGNKGGFAVGGFTPSKGHLTNEYLRVTPDSVRVYIEDPNKGSGSKGGFAVGGFTPGKGLTNELLRVTRDSSRLYVDGNAGFSVGNIATGPAVNYMELTPENYFIGHESGIKTIPGSGDFGKYNTFFGYQAGKENIDGHSNVYIGYQSGMNSSGGDLNVYIGRSAGLNTIDGHENIFIGYEAGKANTSGISNVYIGQQTGLANKTGSSSVYIGQWAGYKCTVSNNCFIGIGSGYNTTTGADNAFYGKNSGYSNATGTRNSYFGTSAAILALGSDNCVFGYNAGYGTANKTYNYNTLMGSQSGYNMENADYNTYYGYYTGYNTTTGYNNTFVGAFAGGNSNTTGYGNVFIGYAAGYNANVNDKLYIDNSTAATPLIYGDFSANRVGINYSTPSHTLSVGGEASKATSGSWVVNSDKRIKTDIRDIENPFETILQLRPVSFRYTQEWLTKYPYIKDKVYYNFIAQEYRQVFPESVYESNDYVDGDSLPVLQMDAYNAQVVTIKAVQELIKMNETQQKTIDALQQKLQQMEQDNLKLKSEVDRIRTDAGSSAHK